MMEKTKVYLLSVENPLFGIILASWITLDQKREVFFVDPARGKREVWALKRLAERMSVVFYDLTEDKAFRECLGELGELAELAELDKSADLIFQDLESLFGQPKGLITASSRCLDKCLQGAILAVSLGYSFLPDVFDGSLIVSGEGKFSLPVVFLGSPEDIPEDQRSGNQLIFLKDEADYYSYLVAGGKAPDYFLMLNSKDLFAVLNEETSLSLSSLKVKGLSLLGLVLATYRHVFLYDIFWENPDSREVEKKTNQLVKRLNFTPKYQTILGAPGFCPFIVEENKEIAGSGEEPIRDIHLQLNHDLFCDVAEGRLFQSTPGGLSLQLLSTKHYHQFNQNSSSSASSANSTDLDAKARVLIATVPYVETGIIFDSDLGLIEGKLKPLLEKAECQVSLLSGKENSAQRVGDALVTHDFFLYSGHGSQKSLNTHRHFLTRKDLPDLPPLIIYASACSTFGVRPDLLSITEGLDWEEIEIPPNEVIGLSLVEKGALSFIGGLTSEDFQFTSSVYSLFFESLLLKGMSVGEALNETKNFPALYGGILSQRAEEAYQISQESLSNIIHQQILLGDPALIPCPRVFNEASLSKNISLEDQSYKISLEIPRDSWKRVEVSITDREPTKNYYQTKSIEHFAPLISDIVSWGDFYHLALDSKGIADKAVMSGFLHLTFNLPPGQAPEKLDLIEAKGQGSCLFCGQDEKTQEDLTKIWQEFVLPYQMLPPVNFDMRSGWPFVVEDLGGYVRVHWLVPAMVIEESSRRGYLGEKFSFKLRTAPGKYINGKIKDEAQSFLIEADHTKMQAVSDLNGEFRMLVSDKDSHVTLAGQFPLFDFWGDFISLDRELYPLVDKGDLEINIKRAKAALLKGRVVDSFSGKPISSALLRVWRGKLDPGGYALRGGLAGETLTDEEGCFSFSLSKGDYLLYLVAQEGSCRYKSKEISITMEEDEQYGIYALDRVGVVKGKVIFENCFPSSPTVILKKYKEKPGETLAHVPIRNDGTFECLVGFQDRFCILIEKEGWQGIRDTNLDQGYKLNAAEILCKEYFLKIKDNY